jgi:uncharacterized protein
MPALSTPCTAFQAARRIARGPLIDVALAVKAASAATEAAPCLIFDDRTGGVVDVDLRGSTADIAGRLVEQARREERAERAARRGAAFVPAGAQGPGRPKLGVVAREVTLLPRHWDWLGAQPGGASQALRRLIDAARRADGGRTEARAAQAATYAFLSAVAGDLPGFEEVARALFAGGGERLSALMTAWPADICSHAEALLGGGGGPVSPAAP